MVLIVLYAFSYNTLYADESMLDMQLRAGEGMSPLGKVSAVTPKRTFLIVGSDVWQISHDFLFVYFVSLETNVDISDNLNGKDR